METNASLGSVIGEFCQDEETKEQLFKAYHEDVYFKKIIAKLEEDSCNTWKKRYFWRKEKGLFLLEDPVPTVNTITVAGTADLYIRNVHRLHGLLK